MCEVLVTVDAHLLSTDETLSNDLKPSDVPVAEGLTRRRQGSRWLTPNQAYKNSWNEEENGE